MQRRALLLCLAGLLLLWHPRRASSVHIVQISDIHLSDYTDAKYPKAGNPLADLLLFSRTVLKALQPAAVLITGDLADSKSRVRSGRQSASEWEAYRRAVDAIRADTGLSDQHILDLRGNHDTFDVAHRGAGNDFFPNSSATGRARPAEGSARQFVTLLGSGDRRACPTVTLLGLDASIEPGPAKANFFGRATNAWLAAAHGVLEGVMQDQRQRGCAAAPTLAFGHFPLGTIGHPDTQPWWPFSVRQPPLQGTANTTKQLLLGWNVSAYVCGHLHDAFGRRLHRLHPQRGGSGRHLAELETAAWMNDRRFRILTVDAASLAFSDLHFRGPGAPAERRPEAAADDFTVEPELPSQKVAGYAVLLTSPPDARYSPLLGFAGSDGSSSSSSSGGASARTFATVEALALPVRPGLPARPQQVRLRWACVGGGPAGELPMAPGGSRRAGLPLSQQPAGNAWSAALPALPCRGRRLHLQALASDGSASELRPVALAEAGGGLVLSEPARPQPLAAELGWPGWAGRIALAVDWPLWACWSAHACWAAHCLGMLLLPRLLLAAAPRLATGAAGSQPGSWGRLLALPLTFLVDMAALPGVWWPQVGYSLYFAAGPWFAIPWVAGRPPALVFLGAVAVFGAGGHVRLEHPADPAIPIVLHTAFCLLPLTLLLAVACTRVRRRSGGRRLSRLLTALHLLAAALPLWFWWGELKHASAGMGWAGYLLSPGVAYTPLLFAFFLWRLRCAATAPAPALSAPQQQPQRLSSAGSGASAKSD